MYQKLFMDKKLGNIRLECSTILEVLKTQLSQFETWNSSFPQAIYDAHCDLYSAVINNYIILGRRAITSYCTSPASMRWDLWNKCTRCTHRIRQKYEKIGPSLVIIFVRKCSLVVPMPLVSHFNLGHIHHVYHQLSKHTMLCQYNQWLS